MTDDRLQVSTHKVDKVINYNWVCPQLISARNFFISDLLSGALCNRYTRPARAPPPPPRASETVARIQFDPTARQAANRDRSLRVPVLCHQWVAG